MRTLLLGASGATGRLVVAQFVEREQPVRVVVREQSHTLDTYQDNSLVEIIRGNIDEFDDEKFRLLMADCDAVISCLGHNISLKGMYGKPRQLVYNQVKKVCAAAKSSAVPKRFILMSTTAYTNRTIGESLAGKNVVIFGLLKALLPPHRDNMLAGDHLVEDLGSDASLEWVAVRPDSLIDEDTVAPYDICETIQRDPLSDPGKTSRIQVAHFMAELLADKDLWESWKYKTPVLYTKA